jgi:hypothetical protein
MLQGGSIRRHILDGHVWNAGTRYLLGAMRKVFEDLFAGKWACAQKVGAGADVPVTYGRRCVRPLSPVGQHQTGQLC